MLELINEFCEESLISTPAVESDEVPIWNPPIFPALAVISPNAFNTIGDSIAGKFVVDPDKNVVLDGASVW